MRILPDSTLDDSATRRVSGRDRSTSEMRSPVSASISSIATLSRGPLEQFSLGRRIVHRLVSDLTGGPRNLAVQEGRQSPQRRPALVAKTVEATY